MTGGLEDAFSNDIAFLPCHLRKPLDKKSKKQADEQPGSVSPGARLRRDRITSTPLAKVAASRFRTSVDNGVCILRP
jgi:hypothetical protein